MARLAVLTALVVALAAVSSGQVVVTNSGFATTPGPAIPATPVSPPILYTPIFQLGQAPTQPIQATAAANGLSQNGATQPNAEQTTVGNSAPLTLEVVPATNTAKSAPTPFNFGVGQFDSSNTAVGIGEDMNGKTLGDVAREQRQHPSTNARVYSNNDIDKLNEVGGTVSAPSAQANNKNDNWSPNNGVITPENSQPAQNSVAAPAQNQTPTGVHSPFAPRSQSTRHAGIDTTPDQPQSRPQSEARPLEKSEGVEMAQNNPQNAPLAQSQSDNSAVQNAPAENQAQAKQLPHTASRLPLIGVAGLFSVTMGIFVRYQRAKAK